MNSFEQQYYESDRFWGGEMLQDPANRERITTTASLIPSDTQSLADVGCGNGIFINYLQDTRQDLKLTAVDRSEMALKYVRTNKQIADIVDLPFSDGAFDCVTCLEVIEHLPIPMYAKALNELARISNRHIIISVPYSERLEDSYTKCPSCKTIFNKEIHLRSFQDEDMKKLFNAHGFECKSILKLHPITNFRGHRLYRRLFYPEQFKTWDSPICPLCGYQTEQQSHTTGGPLPNNGVAPKRKLISYLSSLPKLLWPKEVHYYWILARYTRPAV